MKKALIFVLIISIFTLPLVYSENGEFGDKCTFFTDCKVGLKCYNGKCVYCRSWVDCSKGTCIEGKCVVIPLGGTGCSLDRHCAQGHCYNGKCVECRSWIDCNKGACVNNKCVIKKLKEPCTFSRECESGICSYVGGRKICVECTSYTGCPNGKVCINGECVAKKKKVLKKNGELCFTNNECLSGKCCRGVCASCCSNIDCIKKNGRGYCDSKSLSCKVKKEGESCKFSSECMPGLICDFSTHKCKKYISPWDKAKEGESCKDKRCEFGLYCDPNTKKCVRCYRDDHCMHGYCNLKTHRCTLSKLGGKCNSFFDCEGHSPCMNGVCSVCDSDIDCRSKGKRGVCKKTSKGYWDCIPKKEGDSCHFSWECEENFVCDFHTGKCTKIEKPKPKPVPSPKPKSPKKKIKSRCKDSDGGLNFYEQGTTSLGSAKYTDTCINSSHLKEYYCYNSITIKWSIKKCGNNEICRFGKCIIIPNKKIECNDSEKGLDIHIRGVVTYGKNKYPDTCPVFKGYVLESYCDSKLNRVRYKLLPCGKNEECRGGICIKKSTPSPKPVPPPNQNPKPKPSPTPKPTPNPSPSTSCKDTDGGINLYQKGAVYVGNEEKCRDECYKISYFVYECFCFKGRQFKDLKFCGEGYICKDGRCVKTTSPKPKPKPTPSTPSQPKNKEKLKEKVKEIVNYVRKHIGDLKKILPSHTKEIEELREILDVFSNSIK